MSFLSLRTYLVFFSSVVPFLVPALARAYHFEFIPCNDRVATAAEIEHLRQEVAVAVGRYEAVFPPVARITIRAGYLCESQLERENRVGVHQRGNLARDPVIEVRKAHSSQREVWRDFWRRDLIRRERLDAPRVARYAVEIEQYLDWKLSDLIFQSTIVHELVHELNDHSDLPELFAPFLVPSFEDIESAYVADRSPVVERFRLDLVRRLIDLGVSPDLAQGVGVSPRLEYKSPEPLAANAEIQSVVSEYNQAMRNQRQAEFNDLARQLLVRFGIRSGCSGL